MAKKKKHTKVIAKRATTARPKIFAKKPTKRNYNPATEYIVRNSKGQYVIKTYKFDNKPTTYQQFQKEFSKYLQQNDIDAKEYGGYSKLVSEFWAKEKIKYGFVAGKSKRAKRKNEKAKQNYQEAQTFGQIENDVYDIFQNRKGGGEIVEKLITQANGDIAQGWWNTDKINDAIDYYETGKKVVAVMYDEAGNIVGLKLVESEEDRQDVKANTRAMGEFLHDTENAYATNTIEYDDKTDCLIEYMSKNGEDLDTQIQQQGFNIKKALRTIGVSQRRLTKAEKKQQQINEIVKQINEANKQGNTQKVVELANKLSKLQ